MRALKTTLRHSKASPEAAKQRPSIVGEIHGILAAQALRIPMLAPLGLATGAAIYLTAPSEPAWPASILIVLAALASTQISRIPRLHFLLWPCILATALATGHLAAKIRTSVVAAPVLHQQTSPVRIEGRLVEIDSNDRNQRLRIAVNAIEGIPRESTPAFVRFSYRFDHKLVPGRAVSCTAILSPPPQPIVPGDYQFHRDAWFQQLGAVGFAVSECTPRFAPPSMSLAATLRDRIAAIRRTIAEHVRIAAGEGGGPMAAALVVGDRSFMTANDSEALRQSGLAHLLAISGLHMALAGGAFFSLVRVVWPFAEPLALRVPAVKAAALCAIIGCTAYFLLSGGSIATQRAYIMALIAFSAKLFDKPALSLRSLAIAFAIIVIMNPEAVLTPGFQMSFAASGALVAVYETWTGRRSDTGAHGRSRVLSWTTGVIVTSITASLATTPFAIHHFDRTAVLGIAANLFASPIISLWTAPSATGAMIASLFGWQDIFLSVLGRSLEAILGIAHFAQQNSPDLLSPPIGGGTLLWFAGSIAAFCILTGLGRWCAIIPMMVAMLCWSSEARPVGYVATNGAVYLRGSDGWYQFNQWRTSRALTPLALGSDPLQIDCDTKTECRLPISDGASFLWGTPDAPSTSPPDRSEREGEGPSCPNTAHQLRYTDNDRNELQLSPCDIDFSRGGVIRNSPRGPVYVEGQKPSDRPWSNRIQTIHETD